MSKQHGKLCVIDEAIAFMGGIDLCFGRWDTPQHVLIDDPEESEEPQIWPGKPLKDFPVVFRSSGTNSLMQAKTTAMHVSATSICSINLWKTCTIDRRFLARHGEPHFFFL